MDEFCAICGCLLHREDEYGLPTVRGRSHATAHHHIAERFFGRSSNRRGTQREAMFAECPWGHEGETTVFCYECHEELMHNPVLLPDDIQRLSELVTSRNLSEDRKTEDRTRLAGRIKLFHEVIARGIEELLAEEDCQNK